ncbi:MAG: hypothetical protein JNM09_27695 [Blastocatellia bacterium]|nr:hypothetical protein [Blastocatellia bacterium]
MKSRRSGLTFFLCLLLLPSTPFALRPTASTQVFGGAEISGSCPSGCKLVQNITVAPAEDSNGIRIGINWTTSSLPSQVKMVGFNVSVKLVLKDNKTIDSGEQNHGANASSALVIVQGPATNRNINLSDVKSGTVTVKANAKTTSNPTVNVTSKEIIADDGVQVNMRVRWTPPAVNSPCLAERKVGIIASAENAGGIKFEGSGGAQLSAGTAVVQLKGVGIRRKEMKNLQASLDAKPALLTCGTTKPIQSFGGTGSNP